MDFCPNQRERWVTKTFGNGYRKSMRWASSRSWKMPIGIQRLFRCFSSNIERIRWHQCSPTLETPSRATEFPSAVSRGPQKPSASRIYREVEERIGRLGYGYFSATKSTKAKRARVLGTRALRDLPTDVKPSCFTKVKLLAGPLMRPRGQILQFPRPVGNNHPHADESQTNKKKETRTRSASPVGSRILEGLRAGGPLVGIG